jgi:hypothetical protein
MTRHQLRHLGRWMRNTAFVMICTLFVILMSGFDSIIELLKEWMK